MMPEALAIMFTPPQQHAFDHGQRLLVIRKQRIEIRGPQQNPPHLL